MPLLADASEIEVVVNNASKLEGDADTLILLNLNEIVLPMYGADDVNRGTLGSQFYIWSAPSKGKLYQAYRPTTCLRSWPSSCGVCCNAQFFTLPSGQTTCCNAVSDLNQRLFGIGEEITEHSNFPVMVEIEESGFLWYRPPELVTGAPYDSFNYTVEFWKVDRLPGQGLTSPATPAPTVAVVATNSSNSTNSSNATAAEVPVVPNARITREVCELERQNCNGGQGSPVYCRCSNMSAMFSADIYVNDITRYPQVGFGGHMISFDGGDDYFHSRFRKFPQNEFTIQVWMQQSKRRQGQTLLTYWSDERGREFEIADTSNLQFYHLNNRSQPSGVGVNDGEWHHLAFSWRLVCAEAWKNRGAYYCEDGVSFDGNPVNECKVDEHCLRVDILIIVDGVERATVSLPPFLPSKVGYFVWGQRMLKSLTTAEQLKQDAFYTRQRNQENAETSDLTEPYTDNNLRLVYDRIRSTTLTDQDVFGDSISREAFRGPFTETQPWRDPYVKYCSLNTGGGFDPWAAFSGNLDEIRLYSYARRGDDAAMDSEWVINGDVGKTWSRAQGNYSLILYYSFDLNSAKYALMQRDDLSKWPLDIEDFSSTDGNIVCFDCGATLGGGTFQYAPLQVPSTAPIFGSRTIQIVLPDQRDPVPIDLIDSVRHLDKTKTIYTSIYEMPLYGQMRVGEDDCDIIETVHTTLGIQYYTNKVCKGGLIGLGSLGLSGLFTANCSVGDVLSATDGAGSGFRAVVATINTANGQITSWTFESYGAGYDWTEKVATNLYINNAACMCGTESASIVGQMNKCFVPLVYPGKADISGASFVGLRMDSGTWGFPVTQRESCNLGICPVIKPRPCEYACFREVGWASDKDVLTKEKEKQIVGPYGEQINNGLTPEVHWTNSRHTVWYEPLHIREVPYYIKDDNGDDILQDTIKDQFLVHYFDALPPNPALEDPANPSAPFIHMWVQIILERLAMPINSSFIGEESGPIVTQLQVLDFDRGTCQYNAPFTVHVDPPKRGIMHQAIQINSTDPRFPSECVCWATPQFPTVTYEPEASYYPPNTELPGYRKCDLNDIGSFCMIRGDRITQNDTLVLDYSDSRLLPGFQHSRDGFHVIYELGALLHGLDTFNWRIKHPQGQIEDAKVDIEVRSANKPPVALNGSATLVEDHLQVLKLEGSDIDDALKPTFHVTEPPQNGFLYQCAPPLPGSTLECSIGEKISRQNESFMEWADIVVDPAGALDGISARIYRITEPNSSTELHKTDLGDTTQQVLGGGYGYGTWNFDADLPQNFRAMCGVRGTVAGRMVLKAAAYVTSVEIFYPIRYDTPYRILAKRRQSVRNTTYDYRVNLATGERETLKPAELEVEQVGLLKQTLGAKESLSGPAGELSTAKTFTADTMSCDFEEDSVTACRRLWDGTRWVRAAIDDALTEEPADEWVELYRGMPLHTALYMPGEGHYRPIFPPSPVHTGELRIEACGQEGRIFGQASPNIFGAIKSVRVTGTRTRRPKGQVTDPLKRLVYVPNPDFHGADQLTFRTRDISGGSYRTDWRFSRNQGWSPPAYVFITVTPTVDAPLGTNSVASSPPSDGVGSIVLPFRGHGSSQVGTVFDLHIDSFPSTGDLLTFGGAPAGAVIPGETTGYVRYRPPANACGSRYARFSYRLRDPVTGAFSITYSGTVDVRCGPGNQCDGNTRVCVPCPAGEFGRTSGVLDLCKLCPAGQYQNKTGQTGCINCPAGSFTDRPGRRGCRLCAPGTLNPSPGASECRQCSAGTYQSRVGSTTCNDCGTLSHSRGAGAYSCKDCPTNSRAVIAKAPNESYCTCMRGHYDVNGRMGVDCRACPHGAFCYGAELLPVARTGYWTDRWRMWVNDSQTNDTAPVVRGTAHFAPCNYRYIRGVCIGYPEVNVQAKELTCYYRNSEVIMGPRVLDPFTSAGVDVTVSPCTVRDPREEDPEGLLRPWVVRANYSANSYCAEGYTGTLCSACAVGFRRMLEGRCEKCTFIYDWHWIFGLSYFFAGAGAFTLIWCAMFYFAAYPARSMYILITHLQLLAVLGRFSVPWPDITQRMLNGFSFLNLNFDSWHWNCIGMDHEPYWMRWAFEFILGPLILLGTYLYHVAVVQDEEDVAEAQAIRVKMIKQREEEAKAKRKLEQEEDSEDGGSQGKIQPEGGLPDLHEEESELGSDEGDKKERHGDRDHREALSKEEIQKLRDRALWLMIMMAHVLYVQATTLALVPISCSQIAPGVTVLDWWPNLECNTDIQERMRLAGGGYGFILIIVIPSTLIYILWKSWANELAQDELYRQRWGWMFEHYELKYFWWELVGLLRRIVLVAIQNLFVHHGGIQLVIGVTYLCLHLFATLYAQPHKIHRHNVIDAWLQAQLLFLATYALWNVIGSEGMYIFTTESGRTNDNTRIAILPPGPDMDAIADRFINSSVLSNLLYVILVGMSTAVAFVMVIFDLYEMKLSAPFWAPYALNYVTGAPLFVWDEWVSRVLVVIDLFITRFKDRRKLPPPARPSSRWAHRAMNENQPVPSDRFHAGKSVKDMLEEVVGSTLEQEWARDGDSIREYIGSLDKRVFAAEMYNSKSPNLPSLERERNMAKKRLLKFMQDESASVFRALYDQTGRNEQLIWDMQELERKELQARVIQAGQEEHGKQLVRQREEQVRRVGDIAMWKKQYEQEKKHCSELERYVRQARDALVLYNLEESDESEDEKELDAYLEKQIADYIDSKTAKKLMEEGKLDPMLHLA